MTRFTVDAVLFDLDGTLVDSTASVHRNWQRIATLIGRAGEDLVGALQGIPGSQVLRIVAPELSDERVHELNRILVEGEIDDTADVVATTGAADLVAAIPAPRWGIVTSAPLRLATARLAAAGLPVPRTLVTADDVATGKPDPAPFRLGAGRIGHPPARCLAVEDAPAGIASATRAGCRTVGVLTTYPRLDGDTVPGLSALAVRHTPRGLTVSY
ncbi:HAD-IA family hydrolase [Spirilliplanes yamanashiensis]|uniref:Haloacid dehalogenase n=1 Tax=Spirilliplanes yamanashiensis TaxID=42233 RepID=A0A8J4DJ64_9ACTN|nr:HAD-IA family hydrolase [Spirilliplanes yamanashiensis]MDP9817425.1 sugar-phosphatase [Spirilliplanes yamanashiensis]GIJ02923.1 haloacid dehalogenase [Spirilliplanes yamanashiensis]